MAIICVFPDGQVWTCPNLPINPENLFKSNPPGVSSLIQKIIPPFYPLVRNLSKVVLKRDGFLAEKRSYEKRWFFCRKKVLCTHTKKRHAKDETVHKKVGSQLIDKEEELY